MACVLPSALVEDDADGIGFRRWATRRVARVAVTLDCGWLMERKHPAHGLVGRASEHARHPRVIVRRQARLRALRASQRQRDRTPMFIQEEAGSAAAP